MKRGEIWTAAAFGYGSKPRPVLIIQSKAFDSYDSAIFCLFTSYDSSGLPFRVKVAPSSGNGLEKTSWVMVDKVLTMPQSSFGEFVGELEPSSMEAVSAALSELLGL